MLVGEPIGTEVAPRLIVSAYGKAVIRFKGLADHFQKKDPARCEREYFLDDAKQFNANMLARTSAKIPLVSSPSFFTDQRGSTLADFLERHFKAVKFLRTQF
jgi:hypothetical protein